jgi:hypothetical protein
MGRRLVERACISKRPLAALLPRSTADEVDTSAVRSTEIWWHQSLQLAGQGTAELRT